MSIIQLIYASYPRDALSVEDVGQILDVSRHNNSRDGISGMLCFDNSAFLQCLEGERHVVNQTYHRIMQDPRHHGVMIFRCVEVSARTFSQWTMDYVGQSQSLQDAFFRYGGSHQFDPFALTGESACYLLQYLSEHLDTQE